MSLKQRLEAMKRKQANHDEAVIQVKISTELRDRLLAKLERDGLKYKDLFQAAISEYLEEENEE